MAKYVVLILCFISVFGINGQTSKKDTSINKDVNVVLKYKPNLIDAQKIESIPVIEKPIPTPKSYTYNVVQKQVNTEKIVNPIPAVDLFQKEEFNYPSSYVKLGYGNLNTPLAELYFNNKQDKKYSYGVQYRYLESNTNYNKSFADFADHNAKAYLSTYSDIGEFGLIASYKTNRYNYYGFNDTFDLKKEDLQRVVKNFEAKAYFNSVSNKSDKVKHRSSFYFNQFQLGKNIENDYALKSKIYGNFSAFNDLENGVLSAELGLDYTTLKSPIFAKDQKRLFLTLDPRFDFLYDGLNLSVGFNSTILFEGNDTAKPFFNLYLKGTYPLIEDIATLYAGIDGRYHKQSFKNTITNNPYVSSFNLTNSYENAKLFAGLTAKIGSSADAVFEINYTDVSNMPLFISKNDSLNSFAVRNAQMNILRFNAGFNYSFSEVARIGISGNFYNYSTDDKMILNKEYEPWQLPTIEGKLNAKFNIKNTVYPHIDLVAMSMQKQRSGSNDSSFTTSFIKPFYDVSVGIDFRFKKKISLFVQANNLVAARYSRWFNYPVYGLNYLGGLSFIF